MKFNFKPKDYEVLNFEYHVQYVAKYNSGDEVFLIQFNPGTVYYFNNNGVSSGGFDGNIKQFLKVYNITLLGIISNVDFEYRPNQDLK